MGAVLWRGPSLYDGAPIVVLLTGDDASSGNRKTGRMIQTWILRADVAPHAALALGLDGAVCGTCPLRPQQPGGRRYRKVRSVDPDTGAVTVRRRVYYPSGPRGCYVVVAQAPLGAWRAWRRGSYADASTPEARRELGRGRMVRCGSYGDPAAVPEHVWRELLAEASGWTGYTHGWRARPDLRPYLQASVDSEAEAVEARAAGWRTFRVGAAPAPRPAMVDTFAGRASGPVGRNREILCPASEEAGRRTTCEACGLCSGAGPGGRLASAASVYIPPHGAGRKLVARRLPLASAP